MTLYGLGIDVVEVDRVRSSMNEFGEQFLNRIFTENERLYCENQKNKDLSYAARFAAKEAIAKAFGTGIGKSMSWKDLEVHRKPSGEPSVILHGKAQELAASLNVLEIKLSLTHAKHYAAANAVILLSS